MRDWVTNLATTHYLVGSASAPHPFPTLVRDFQKVIGKEIKSQLQAIKGKLPDVVVACVGGGSNAIGTFYDFIPDKSGQIGWVLRPVVKVPIGQRKRALLHTDATLPRD